MYKYRYYSNANKGPLQVRIPATKGLGGVHTDSTADFLMPFHENII